MEPRIAASRRLGRSVCRRLRFRRPAGSAVGQRPADRLVAPSRGGQIYELDVRSICHNLLATLSRRPEAYHRRVKAGPRGAGGSVIDANSPVKFKQAGLENRLQYDCISSQEPARPLVRRQRLARRGGPGDGDGARRFSWACRSKPSSAAIRAEFRCSSPGQGTHGACRLKITKGVTLDGRQQRAGNRLSDRGLAARSVDALFGRVQFRRHARRGRRPLLPRRRLASRPPSGPSRLAARPGRMRPASA